MFTRSRNYSSRSWSYSSSGGGALISRAPGSVYGDAVGHRVRRFSMFPGAPSSELFLLFGDVKSNMQNLNDRLASYLEKVRNLEAANGKLEQKIREYYEEKTPIQGQDLTGFFSTISDLRAQILSRKLEEHSIILRVDNARMTAQDYKNKYELELNMGQSVESDIACLQRARDRMTLACGDLEIKIKLLRTDLDDIKRNHGQELLELQKQHSAVNVEMDCAESSDMAQVISDMRKQYDIIIQKNQRELQQWFQTQMEVTQTTISTCTTEVKTSQTELSALKTGHQSLLIELQALLSKKSYLEQRLEEVCGHNSAQLSQLQLSIDDLEAELRQRTVSSKQQATDKYILEQEIAEYCRLLDGEGHTGAVEIKEGGKVEVKVIVCEEYKPHLEKRVITKTENLVDGKVVSSTEDTEVTQIQCGTAPSI